jgi:hypothetical protein
MARKLKGQTDQEQKRKKTSHSLTNTNTEKLDNEAMTVGSNVVSEEGEETEVGNDDEGDEGEESEEGKEVKEGKAFVLHLQPSLSTGLHAPKTTAEAIVHRVVHTHTHTHTHTCIHTHTHTHSNGLLSCM